MIVPLEFKIERVEQRRGNFETLQDGTSENQPVYCVLAVVIDTESEEVMVYDLHTLVDNSHEPPRIGMMTYSKIKSNREYLRSLRDQLNEVLS